MQGGSQKHYAKWRVKKVGGEGGIRTLSTGVSPYNGLATGRTSSLPPVRVFFYNFSSFSKLPSVECRSALLPLLFRPTATQKRRNNMTASAKPIPKGFHTVTPSLVVRNAAQAIEFYKKALGAKELMRMPSPAGKIYHAELQIGDSIIFVSDEFPTMGVSKSPQTLGGCTGTLNLYVD